MKSPAPNKTLTLKNQAALHGFKLLMKDPELEMHELTWAREGDVALVSQAWRYPSEGGEGALFCVNLGLRGKMQNSSREVLPLMVSLKRAGSLAEAAELARNLRKALALTSARGRALIKEGRAFETLSREGTSLGGQALRVPLDFGGGLPEGLAAASSMVLALVPPSDDEPAASWGLFAVDTTGPRTEDKEGHPFARMLLASGSASSEAATLAEGRRAVGRVLGFYAGKA
jgi:hypothetical protein